MNTLIIQIIISILIRCILGEISILISLSTSNTIHILIIVIIMVVLAVLSLIKPAEYQAAAIDQTI